MDILEELKKIILSPKNIIICDEGTMFESSYPRIVVDCVSTKNEFLDIKTLESLESIKALKIKNQKSERFLTANPKDILSIVLKDDKIVFKYLKDGKRKQLTI